MLSTPRRTCSNSATFPMAAISRKSSGGRMTAMSSMNKTALASDIGGLAHIDFQCLEEACTVAERS